MKPIDFRKKKTFVMEVTPTMARHMLNYMKIPKRPVNWENVDRLAEKMKNGTWVPEAERGISFLHTGSLADGQYRLNAIIKAGIPVKIQINTCIDGGKFLKRTETGKPYFSDNP